MTYQGSDMFILTDTFTYLQIIIHITEMLLFCTVYCKSVI